MHPKKIRVYKTCFKGKKRSYSVVLWVPVECRVVVANAVV
jgi:hypothetical protein